VRTRDALRKTRTEASAHAPGRRWAAQDAAVHGTPARAASDAASGGPAGGVAYTPSMRDAAMDDWIRRLPKAELHLHVEGTLEPEHLLQLAAHHRVQPRFATLEALRAAYDFRDLQSFLDLYYEGAAVLRSADDFRALTWAYLERAAADGVRRAEIFFDPQTHTERGIALETVLSGITSALDRSGELGISSGLILCFLRHLSADDALATLDAALPHRAHLLGLGLDSSELGHPPSKFTAVFERGRREGLHVVAHAGEEGPPEYIWQALDLLGAERIDHGVRAIEDDALMDRLAADQIPLTMCPLSNLRLRVVKTLADHPLREMLHAGVKVTLHSDDPAYFGGYVAENYAAAAEALDLSRDELTELARNSLEASFAEPGEKRRMIAELEAAAPLASPLAAAAGGD
jgi:adenine deaminase